MSKRTSPFILLFALFLLVFLSSTQAKANWQSDFKSSRSPVADKLLFWLNVTETNNSYAAKDLIGFTLANPHWPKLHEFRSRIERNMSTSTPATEVASWFDQNPPEHAAGIKLYITALHRLGHDDRARNALRSFWLTADLNKSELNTLATRYKQFFPLGSHADRLDNLIWEARYDEAEDMYAYVDHDHIKLADARIALGRMSSKAQKLLAKVPPALQNDPGLLFERLKWRRRMNKDSDAYALIRQLPNRLPHAEQFWEERNILARRAIKDRDYTRAYKIIFNHSMTSGADYAQAEWMMGWISLTFLNKPDRAYRHFENFYQAVSSAVSRSRATYWLARAAEALNQPEAARNWDTLATQFPSTFYGQLSYDKIYGDADPANFLQDHVSPEHSNAFDKNELVQAIRLLSRTGHMRYADPFFAKLLDRATTRADFIMTAKLARSVHRIRYAVEANKQLQQKLGDFIFTEGYPLLPSGIPNQPEEALINAIVYRESMFDTEAQSPVGALGLMQLMPSTAKYVAKNIGKNYSVGKLTDNPRYNVELGAAYLQRLLKGYDGCYPLAIAAYNAGPGNVAKWLRDYGDPCRRNGDLINWIEKIPLNETRNYVHRVMETYYIYKLRLSERPKTVFELIR